MTIEEWKPVIGYEASYRVSNLGKVKSIDRTINVNGIYRFVKGRVLKTQLSKTGYEKVVLHSKNKAETLLVHRLVALAFIPNHNQSFEIDHIDGVKTNNKLENLEWVSRSVNIKRAFNNGLKGVGANQRNFIKELGKSSNKELVQLSIDGNYIKTWHSLTEASKSLNINPSSISMVCNQSGLHTRYKAGGYKWKYKSDYNKEEPI